MTLPRSKPLRTAMISHQLVSRRRYLGRVPGDGVARQQAASEARATAFASERLVVVLPALAKAAIFNGLPVENVSTAIRCSSVGAGPCIQTLHAYHRLKPYHRKSMLPHRMCEGCATRVWLRRPLVRRGNRYLRVRVRSVLNDGFLTLALVHSDMSGGTTKDWSRCCGFFSRSHSSASATISKR